jgi:hypothetical protein
MMDHAHVTTICRHCANPSDKFVAPTLEEARAHLRGLPAFFRSDPDLHSAEFQIIDQDLSRIKINSHDLLVFTLECNAPFEECFAAYQQAIMMANMARKLEKALKEVMGDDPQKFLENILNNPDKGDSNPQPNLGDRSSSILNQLNLPDDFFTQGA